MDPDARSSSLPTQLMESIRDPLHGVTDAPSPVVIVLDALDESKNAAHTKQIDRLITGAADSFPPHLRLQTLITNRPEVYLNAPLTSTIGSSVLSVATLHDIEQSIVKADIRLYLQVSPPGAADIVSDNEVDRSVEMAQGLFIVASTAVGFICVPFYSSPKERLAVLLSAEEGQRYGKENDIVSWGTAGSGPLPYLAFDEMYLRILLKAFLEKFVLI